MGTIGDRLRETRGALSMAKAAALVGISQQAWNLYEKDSSAPGAKLIIRICEAFHTSADWLLGIDRPPSSSVAVRGSAVSPGRQPTTNSPTRNSPTTNYQPPTTKSAPGTLPQCARCEHRKLAEKMRKMLGGG